MTRAIASKEMKVLWASPLPYVLGAVMHATLGTLAWSQVAARGQAVFQPVVPIVGFLLVLVAPVLAARVFSEEIAAGTLELLLSAQVAPRRLVAGKFVALTATLLAILAPSGLFALFLVLWGDPDPGPILAGYLGLALMAAALAAVGMAASAWTSSQPVAAIAGLFSVLVAWFAHIGDQALPTVLTSALSLSERLRPFAGGVVDLSDVVFFASVAAAALAVAGVGVSSRRWR